jgi:flagellar biosynthetic protein FliQ
VTPETTISTVQKAIEVTMMISAPMLLAALVVGLIISVFQAATQINEMTLSFIPKLLTMVVVMVIAGPWMTQTMMDYTIRLYSSIPAMID